MNIFKISGLLILLSALTLFGFFKAGSLVKRSRTLSLICISLEKLAQLIKNGTGETNQLFSLSFEKNILTVRDGMPKLIGEGLLKEDIELFNKLLGEIGIAHREEEYKRIVLYKTLFEKQEGEAKLRAESLSKLYSTCGFLTGLSICIFLI